MEALWVRHWWALALRGVVALLFGIAALIWPGITLAVLVLMFGAYALVDGAFAVVSAARGRGRRRDWWVVLLEGLAGIIAGIFAFLWPLVAALVLVYLIAAWALFTGVMEIIAAVRLRREIENEWLLALTGVASIIFGVLLMVWPVAGALAVVTIIGIYAIVFGIVMLILAFRLRRRPLARATGV
jgi:uncharacterized membrane protein HdeD (DUF308 family)